MNEAQTAPHLTVPENVYLLINHQIFLLDNPVTRIGRQLENDLVIQDMLVSRQHARISFEKEQFVLEDLESTGGTFINGNRVGKSVLNHGDLINIANVVIKFVCGNSEINQETQRRTDSLA